MRGLGVPGMNNMGSLTSLNYNNMEDNLDLKNRRSFKQQLNDPNMGFGPLTSRDSLWNIAPGPDPNQRVTRKRSQLAYDQYPGNSVGVSGIQTQRVTA